LDYLVGAREQRWRHGDAERLGSPKIDNRREFGGLFDWNVAGLGTQLPRWSRSAAAPFMLACPRGVAISILTKINSVMILIAQKS
jgi:hypothetical protein